MVCDKSRENICNTHDDMQIVKKMKEIVPEYKSRQSRFEVLNKKN